MVIGDAAAGVVALINLHTGEVATAGTTTETAAAADGPSSAPPSLVNPSFLDGGASCGSYSGTAAGTSEGMFDSLRAAPSLPVDLDVDEELPVDLGVGDVDSWARATQDCLDGAVDTVVDLAVSTAHADVVDPVLKPLLDRLVEEGLSLADLSSSDDNELNTLLEEPGFMSAILRAKMRKALRALVLI